MRILVVEDDSRMASTIKDIFRQAGFQVDVAGDGIAGLDSALSGIYDLVVLDVLLPKMDGFEVVRELRRSSGAVPVLMLTVKSRISDKVNGLDSGADYYLTKPFSPQELVACAQALLRRPREFVPEGPSFADISLDISAVTLRCGDSSIALTARELTIMQLLMSAGARITSKDTLLTRAWGFDSNAEDNNVESFISLLRKKLRFIGSGVVIKNERMLGYRLEAPGCTKS